ncbi:alpha/beta hydrolase [Oceanobacillus timonensis]|uniref:alpha/beta hydrolase n=1 Tax=Oceanobacillus timonensis TaxID=1926285 RepID=UPI003183AD22
MGNLRRKGKMFEKEIHSSFLEEMMTLQIYHPETFSDAYPYEICIMQDGKDYFQMGRVATLSDKLHDEEALHNVVFVGIHYKDKYDRRKKYHPSGEQNEAYIHFLVREVVPYLDELIPAHQAGKKRSIIGDSLAGTLALMTAMKYPHLFEKAGLQSPYVDDTVLAYIEQTSSLAALDIYHTIGTKETDVHMSDGNTADFVEPNRQLHQALKKSGAAYTYYELADGIHTWKYWQNDMRRLLTTLFD